MKQISYVLFLLATVLMASCATAPEPPKTALAQTTPAAQSSANAEQEVRKKLDDWVQADLKNDLKWYEKHIAENIIYTNPEGGVYDKKGMLSGWDPNSKTESEKFDDVQLRNYGDIVVTSFQVTAKGRNKTEDYSGTYRMTTVWKKNAGDWQVVAHHQAKVKSGK